ncbi:MAG: hypothetical protein IKZ44_08110 [Clostridia bacterium]|nr:hypothetical protein [Clostridia bacterium]
MNHPKKRVFADSPLYSIICSILAILMMIVPIVLLAFFGIYIQFFVIIANARELGGWWIVLTAANFLVLITPMALLIYIRDRREKRYMIGDELYFVMNDKTLWLELQFERAKRVLHEFFTHSTVDKSRKEQFLETCYEKQKQIRKELK